MSQIEHYGGTMEQFAEIVRNAGGEMSYQDFQAAARDANLQGRLWLQAKHAGVIRTWIDQEGNHMVGLPVANPEGGA